MSPARCLSITRHKTHLQAGADYFSPCWEFKHTDVALEASLRLLSFFIIGFLRSVFCRNPSGLADGGLAGRHQRVSKRVAASTSVSESVFQ